MRFLNKIDNYLVTFYSQWYVDDLEIFRNYDDLQVDKEAKSHGDILQVDFWNINLQPIDWGIINQSI